MKKCLLGCMWIACLFMVNCHLFAGEMDAQAWQKFDALENAGQHDLARQVFFSIVADDPSDKDIKLLLQKNKRLLGYEDDDLDTYSVDFYSSAAMQRFFNGNPNSFTFQFFVDYGLSIIGKEKVSESKTITYKKYECWLVFHQKYLKIPYHIQNSVFKTLSEKEKKDTVVNPLPNMVLDLKNKDEINSFLAKYDSIKISIESLKKIIEQKIKQCDNKDLKDTLKIYSLLKNQKQGTKIVREFFLNYTLNSYFHPCYTISLFTKIAYDGQYLSKDDELEMLNDIGKYLSLACHKQLLFQSPQDCRDAFWDIISNLKKGLSAKQFEEFKARYSLLDSNDPSKPSGSDAWWK